ncbi:MAG: DUF3108 domain-containing protein [Candidatus Eisenbacteria bacterium]
MKRMWMTAAAAVTVGSMVPVMVFGTVPHEAGAQPLLIDGERLKFEILYGSIPAGHAWLEVTGETGDDGEVFRITSTALSNDVISIFFRVEDRIESVVDAATFEPRYFEKRLKEGPFRKHEQVYYGDGVVRSGDGAVEVEPGTMDILSALYYVRGQDLRVGEDVSVSTFDGGTCYNARVKVLRKETVRTGNRSYDCVVIEPELVDGPFARTGRILIWLTDDALRLPVLMKSKVKIGSFVARLVGSTHTGGAS